MEQVQTFGAEPTAPFIRATSRVLAELRTDGGLRLMLGDQVLAIDGLQGKTIELAPIANDPLAA